MYSVVSGTHPEGVQGVQAPPFGGGLDWWPIKYLCLQSSKSQACKSTAWFFAFWVLSYMDCLGYRQGALPWRRVFITMLDRVKLIYVTPRCWGCMRAWVLVSLMCFVSDERIRIKNLIVTHPTICQRRKQKTSCCWNYWRQFIVIASVPTQKTIKSSFPRKYTFVCASVVSLPVSGLFVVCFHLDLPGRSTGTAAASGSGACLAHLCGYCAERLCSSDLLIEILGLQASLARYCVRTVWNIQHCWVKRVWSQAACLNNAWNCRVQCLPCSEIQETFTVTTVLSCFPQDLAWWMLAGMQENMKNMTKVSALALHLLVGGRDHWLAGLLLSCHGRTSKYVTGCVERERVSVIM